MSVIAMLMRWSKSALITTATSVTGMSSGRSGRMCDTSADVSTTSATTTAITTTDRQCA